MKKLENFSKTLEILHRCDFSKIDEDDIYRTGVATHFGMCFEHAWKAMQAVLRLDAVSGSENGSPREILKLAYKNGLISDPNVWLMMQKKGNTVVHEYNEEEVIELMILIRDSFIPAFDKLEKTLTERLAELEKDSLD